MARVLSIATVLGLLAASAVAFAITEGAKLTRSPIEKTFVTKTFSPKARAARFRTAYVRFELRSRDTVTVWIENAHGDHVRTLLDARTLRAGARVDVGWDGFSEDGQIVPDGVYKPVVKLERSHRVIGLPNPIALDTKPPVISVPHPLHPILSPDGDGYGDRFVVRYRIDERAHAILTVRHGARTHRVELTLSQQPHGKLEWNGKIGGEPVRPGAYVLSVSARDLAGNVSAPFPFAVANVRYVSLGRSRVSVAPGRRFSIRVSTDAPKVRWKLRGRSGVARRGTLHFTAPRTPGTYYLYVFVGDHAARTAVVVG